MIEKWFPTQFLKHQFHSENKTRKFRAPNSRENLNEENFRSIPNYYEIISSALSKPHPVTLNNDIGFTQGNIICTFSNTSCAQHKIHCSRLPSLLSFLPSHCLTHPFSPHLSLPHAFPVTFSPLSLSHNPSIHLFLPNSPPFPPPLSLSLSPSLL